MNGIRLIYCRQSIEPKTLKWLPQHSDVRRAKMKGVSDNSMDGCVAKNGPSERWVSQYKDSKECPMV